MNLTNAERARLKDRERLVVAAGLAFLMLILGVSIGWEANSGERCAQAIRLADQVIASEGQVLISGTSRYVANPNRETLKSRYYSASRDCQ